MKSSTRARERRYVEEGSEGDTPPPHSHHSHPHPHPATHHHPHTTSVNTTCHIWIRACYTTPPTTDPRRPSPPYPHPTRTIPSPTLAPLPLLPSSPSLPPTLDIHHRHTHHVPCSGCSGSHQLGPAARGNSRGPPLLRSSVQWIHSTETWETWIMVGEGGKGVSKEGAGRREGMEVGRVRVLIDKSSLNE